MTPRGRLPESWGDSPPDKLAGCTMAFIKMVIFGFLFVMISSATIGLIQDYFK